MKKIMTLLGLLTYGSIAMTNDSYLKKLMSPNTRPEMFAGAQRQLAIEGQFVKNAALQGLAAMQNHEKTQAFLNHSMTQSGLKCFEKTIKKPCVQGYQSLSPEQQTSLKVVLGFEVAVMAASKVFKWIDRRNERNRRIDQGTQFDSRLEELSNMALSTSLN